MLLWYAAYGSNLLRDRFLSYLGGGLAAGAVLPHTGARDPRPPLAEASITMAGALRFGITSTVWGGGGVAIYDADAMGDVLARAYLVTQEQFGDVAAQEMHREPGVGADIDLGAALLAVRHVGGPGHYETVHRVGEIDGSPVVTFTADRPRQILVNPPGPAYLRTLAAGLRESHGLCPAEVADYLLRGRGVAPYWSREDIEQLARTVDHVPPAHIRTATVTMPSI